MPAAFVGTRPYALAANGGRLLASELPYAPKDNSKYTTRKWHLAIVCDVRALGLAPLCVVQILILRFM